MRGTIRFSPLSSVDDETCEKILGGVEKICKQVIIEMELTEIQTNLNMECDVVNKCTILFLHDVVAIKHQITKRHYFTLFIQFLIRIMYNFVFLRMRIFLDIRICNYVFMTI